MSMDLPIPFEHRGIVVRSAEMARPTAGDLAEVARLAQGGDPYAAMSAFVVGGTSSIGGDGATFATKQERIEAVRNMPFPDTNFAIVQILLSLGCRDTVEEVHTCPRCSAQVISDEDNPDKISDLKVRVPEGTDPPVISIELSTPIKIENDKGDIVDEVTSIEMHYPTMADCSKAVRRRGLENPGGLNLDTLRNAITKVNGRGITEKYRAEFGDLIVARIDTVDMRAINAQATKYGYDDRIDKLCPKCGKAWKAPVDVTGFFVSGLRELSA